MMPFFVVMVVMPFVSLLVIPMVTTKFRIRSGYC